MNRSVPHWQVFREPTGKWRYRLMAENRRLILQSTGDYDCEGRAKAAIKAAQKWAGMAAAIEVVQ